MDRSKRELEEQRQRLMAYAKAEDERIARNAERQARSPSLPPRAPTPARAPRTPWLQVEPRVYTTVRFLGDLLPGFYHWPERGRSFPCFYKECKLCPSLRDFYAYAPALVSTGGQEVLCRFCLTQKGDVLGLLGSPIRGWLVEFWREAKYDVATVDVLETTAPPELVAGFDMRRVCVERWKLPYWPECPAELLAGMLPEVKEEPQERPATLRGPWKSEAS